MSNLNERQNLRKALATFTSHKMDWINAIAEDRRLGPIECRVAVAIGRYVNQKTLKAWPSQETIADKAGGISVRQVQRAVKRLCDTGWLTRERKLRIGASDHPSNVYTMRFENFAAAYKSTSSPSLSSEGVPSLKVFTRQPCRERTRQICRLGDDDDYSDLPHFAAALRGRQ